MIDLLLLVLIFLCLGLVVGLLRMWVMLTEVRKEQEYMKNLLRRVRVPPERRQGERRVA